MALIPNNTFFMNGVLIREKIIPDGTVWKDDLKAKAQGCKAGDLYKKNQKLSLNTGKIQGITIHNTEDIKSASDDGEVYTRSTYNENMGLTRVHYYVDNTGAWQNLKAGTGLSVNDPKNSAEVGWHAGDGSSIDGGNMTTIALEVIMNENSSHDLIAKDNAARIAAYILWINKLGIDKVYSHTYWVNKLNGKIFSDPDVQSTNIIYNKKWCPTYIFQSSNQAIALKNWRSFKAQIKVYLDALNKSTTTNTTTNTTPKPETTTTELKFKNGDIVEFIGTKHYTTAYSSSGYACKPGKATISAIPNASYKHPYCCIATKGGTSTVYGWVDAKDVKAIATTTTVKKKSIDEVATLVCQGKYGVGTARTNALKAEGYTDAEIVQIQKKVNEMFK